MEFTRLEQALLAWIRERCDPAIGDQLRNARLKSRDATGVGFFVHLDHEAPASGRPQPAFECDPIPGPEIVSPQLPNGAGSVLFVTDGVPDVLEVFTYGDEFPEELSDFHLAEPPDRTE